MAEYPRGLDLRAGFQREAVVTTSTWPVVAPAALTALLPLLDVQPDEGVQKRGSIGPVSGLGPTAFDVLNVTPRVTVPWKLRYEGFEQLVACALGHGAKRLNTVVMPESLGMGAYRHLYELDARLSTAEAWQAAPDGFQDGELLAGQRKVRRGTLAVNFGISVWEWLSAMVQTLTMTVVPAGVTLAVDFVSHSLGRTSVVNTVATLAHLAPITAPPVNSAEMVCRVAPYSASVPLGSGDSVQVSSWSLKLENHLKATYGPRTGLAPEEYERDQPPTVTVTLTPPRHRTDAWQTRWRTVAPLMMDMKLTGPLMQPAGFPYACNVYLPTCQVMQAAPQMRGAGLPSDTVQLQGQVPTAPAAGFPTMQRSTPLAIELQNGVNQHALL